MALLKPLLALLSVFTLVSHVLPVANPAFASPRTIDLASQARVIEVRRDAPSLPKTKSLGLDEKSTHSFIPVAQGQPITRTWNFTSGQEGWIPVDYGNPYSNGQPDLTFWEKTPQYGGGDGVWRAPAFLEGGSQSDSNSYIYISFPSRISMNRVELDYYIRNSGLGGGWAYLKIYTSTDQSTWTQVAYSGEIGGNGYRSTGINATVNDSYVMIELRIKRWLGWGAYGYLDNLTLIDCIGCDPLLPSLQLDILDPAGTPVTQVITNTDGWPTPNPLTVQVTLNCPAGGGDCIYPDFGLTIEDNNPPSKARFFVYEAEANPNPGEVTAVCLDGASDKTEFSYQSYIASCTRTGPFDMALNEGETKQFEWSIWLQPSEAVSLGFTATWGDETDSKTVQIPKAEIHPVVIIPGYVATWPPEDGGDLDPLQKTYDNLVEALQKIGYELGEAGSGATLIPFGWDWRAPFGDTGRILLEADVDSIRDVSNRTKSYVDYEQVDIIAHSAGGLVARAFIEDSSANNQTKVNELITLGTPHRGTPAAYRGGRGGQYSAIFPDPDGDIIASGVTAGLLFCENNFWRDIAILWPGLIKDRIRNEIVLNEDVFHAFIRDHIPSTDDLLPTSDVTPEYIVDNLNPSVVYPYGNPAGSPPDNPFLEDMTTSGGNYDVSKLLVPNILSIFSSNHPDQSEGIYSVDAPPYGQGNNVRWGHGQIVPPFTLEPGDRLIPAYSADLTQISVLSDVSNITAFDAVNIEHLGLPAESIMVRRIISNVTGIDVVNNSALWTKARPQPLGQVEAVWELATCSPVRTLVTDPLGRQAGLDLDTGAIINEIPDAIVTKDGDEPHLIIVPQVAGQYQVQTKGIGDGAYTISALKIFSGTTEVVARVFTGTTTIGQSRQFNFESAAFQEEDGQVVMEAERFTGQVGVVGRTWMSQTTQAGYVGSGYVTTQPDVDQIYTQTFTTTSPRLEYNINFTTPGTYTIWLRGYAPNAAGDSVYVALDDQPPAILTGLPPRQWAWQETSLTYEVTESGEQTLFLWQREDGLRIDRILLTTASGYNPQGNGPSESPRIGDN